MEKSGVVKMAKRDGGEPFFGGVSTEPDVKRLRDVFPEQDLVVGKNISYEDVERVIRQSRKTSRFWTVTNAWRESVMRDFGKVIKAMSGTHFHILTEPEKVVFMSQKIDESRNRAKRALRVGLTVDRKQLAPEALRLLDHESNKAAAIESMARVRANVSLPEI